MSMVRRATLGTTGIIFVSLGILNSRADAATPQPAPTAQASLQPAPTTPVTAPKFEPVPGAIVNGLSGLVAATSGLKDWRSIRRTMIFRTALAEKLSSNPNISEPITIQPSNSLVLCSMRGEYAAMNAQMTYITSLTNTLNQFATPSNISTIGDAFKSVIQSYSIDDKGAIRPVQPQTTIKACQSDIEAWPVSYYGVTFGGTKEALGLDIGTDVSAFVALFSALNNIITPIVTAGAQALDATKRAQKITSYLEDPNIQPGLLKAADSLAKNGDVIVTETRLQALGVFEEKLAAVRTFKIDLSKINACKPLAPPPAGQAGAAPAGSSDATPSGPTDEFVFCYAQAWAQLNDPVEAAITAAAQYDALADAPSAQIKAAVKAIHDNMGKLKNPNQIDQLVDAATQLITLGKAITTALSPDNMKALQTDAANVMKLFK
jgi:hypothetical protein